MINNLEKFHRYIDNKKLKKIFLITGKNSFLKSGAKKIINSIKNKKIKYFYKKENFPEYKELKKISIEIKNFNPDIILAIGGGAVMDYGKIASVVDEIKKIKKIITKNNVPKFKSYPLVAIPTTSGSGAEVTPNAVMYIDKTKYTVDKKIVKPNKFFLLPKLTFSASKSIKASSGFDAVAQSIESLLSIKSTSQSVKFAKKSLEYSLKSFTDFVNRPSNFNAEKMMLAAHMSGKAIAISKTTAPHAISYPFTAHFGIPHGHAVSLTLDKLLLFNYKNAQYAKTKFDLIDRYKIIFKLTNTKNINDLFFFIQKLKKLVNLNDNFKSLGININKEKIKILSGVNEQRLANNPVQLNVNEIISIIS
tara:strand:+ start:1631 stop:2719 length:1089 start_codon:yes stop_codon:yes gene_type:complete